jgi:O-antigen ligase
MIRAATVVKALVILVTTALALLFSLVLLQSETAAIVVYVLGLGIATIFIEPFIGLLNYFVFLYVRPQEFIPGFVGLPVMLALGSLTFVLMLLHMGIKKKVIAHGGAPQSLLMIWFLVAIAASNMAHFNMTATKDSVREFMSPFLLYFMIAMMVDSEKKVKLTLYLMATLTAFLAYQGIKQYYTGVGIAGQELFQGRIVSIGIFADPNDLALALLIMLPFCLLEFVRPNHIAVRLLNLVFGAALAVTVVMTDSRGGILSLGLLVIALFWRRFGWKVGVAVGALTFVAMFVVGPSRMGTISTTEDSASARIDSWSVAIDLIQSNPIFGVGCYQFTEYHHKTTHNSYLLCGSELGLFGYVPWVLMIYFSIKNLYFISKEAVEKRHGRIGRYADGVLWGLIAFLFAATFLSRTYIELVYILFGLSAAITTVFVQRDGGRYQLMSKNDLLIGAGLAVGSIFFFKIFVMWAWL